VAFLDNFKGMMLEILYRDESVIAINKPAGLLVHRSRIDVHAKEFAVQALRDQIGQPVFLAHRLDRPTSGVLLFALSSEVARQLAQQFADRQIKKTYHAIVRGHTPAQIQWDDPLVERRDRITDQRASSENPAKPATTLVTTIRHWTVPYSAGKYPQSRYSLVTAKPLTGRKHQLRRHFNHMAHPIVGDTSHGDRRHNRLFRTQFHVRRLLLVASALCFQHPVSELPITIAVDWQHEFRFALEALDAADCQDSID
jgi:tRNA pseudouridine65 synthase